MIIEGDGQRQPPRLLAEGGRHPRVSPDGRRVVYAIGLANLPYGRLYLSATDGSPPKQLVPEFEDASYPVWSPDGDRILFVGSRSNDEWDWWVTDPDSGDVDKTGAFAALRAADIETPSKDLIPSSWFALENRVLFSVAMDDSASLWALKVSPKSVRVSATPERLSTGTEPQVHPFGSDGNLVYFTWDKDGFRCIYARRLDPVTKTPMAKEPIEVVHFHRARFSMLNLDLYSLGMDVGPDSIIFNLAEGTADLWMGQLESGH